MKSARTPRRARGAQRSSRRSRARRAQTTIDFAIGAGIFLLVVAFAFAFTPGALAPFTDAEQPQSADRAASKLVGGELGSADDPYLLDRTCTVAFFDYFRNDRNVTADCQFDTEADSINQALGIREFTNVNVTVQRHDGSVRTLTNDAGDSVRLVAGEERIERTPMTTARRTVRLNGSVHRLVVHVW